MVWMIDGEGVKRFSLSLDIMAVEFRAEKERLGKLDLHSKCEVERGCYGGLKGGLEALLCAFGSPRDKAPC